ncbi:MAG: sulfotransferase [Candidatus Aminicenantes bacterium]|nr:sulfotransferase [Candidatus Aminicenantes bacterium]
MNTGRQKEFRRNTDLETLLAELNGLLAPVEQEIIATKTKPAYPVVLIVGAPRSGTTLLMQWLAGLNYFAYPSNLLSRFYGCPYIGAKIQRLLLDPKFNFNDEFSDFGGKIDFSSNLGKTQGILSPNEFWYFWRRFFSFGEIQYLDKQRRAQVNSKSFLAELAALEAAFEKPFAMKGMIINWNIPFVAEILKKVLFIYVYREPQHNAQSLLQARVKFFGTEESWYSFKPPEYSELQDLPAVEQVCGQVHYTNRAIREGLRRVDSSKWIETSYEEFCTAPGRLFSQIKEKFSRQGYEVGWDYKGPRSFESTNRNKFPQARVEKIIAAGKKFPGPA